ncbi:cobyrinic acid a,c-diamide synthase, partial [Bacillus cereus]
HQGKRVDNKVLQQAQEMYGGNVLETIVRYQERLKVYDIEGIHKNVNVSGNIDMWDEKAHQLFIDVLSELNEHENYFATINA